MRRTAALVIAALCVSLSACSAPAPEPQTAAKHSDGRLRTDLAPLAERYSQLASAESVEWMGGTLGSRDVGPSTYWVDVIAVMPESEIDVYRSTADLVKVDPPTLVDDLAPKLPTGPFEGSPELDDLFSSGGHGATVAIDPQTRTVVLSGVFG